jgi:hypothetical protein
MTRLRCLIAALIVGWLVAPASATTLATFALDNVTFTDGGTASGGFTLDLTTGSITAVTIITTPGDFGAVYTDGGFANSPTASFSFAYAPDDFLLTLDIYLAVMLTPANVVASASFELEPRVGERFFFFLGCAPPFPCYQRAPNPGSFLNVVSVTQIGAVPVPAALPLFVTGLGAIGFLASRRRRKVAAAA